VPTDQEIKTYWIHHMPNSIKEALRLWGLNQDSDLGELKEALDESDAQYHRDRLNQGGNRGRNGNQAEGDNGNRNQERSHSHSLGCKLRRIYDQSSSRNYVPNRNFAGSSSMFLSFLVFVFNSKLNLKLLKVNFLENNFSESREAQKAIDKPSPMGLGTLYSGGSCKTAGSRE
jgi:hypothetical protein